MKTQIITSMLALSMLTVGSLAARADDTSANKPLPVNQAPSTQPKEVKEVKEVKVQKKRKGKAAGKTESKTEVKTTTDQGTSEKKPN